MRDVADSEMQRGAIVDERRLLEVVKARYSSLFDKKLTDETACALLSAAFQAVRQQVADTEDGLLRIENLGTFRMRRVERNGQGKGMVRKVVQFSFKEVSEPRLVGIAKRRYGKGGGAFAAKPASFWAEYERLFAAVRHNPLRILELGVKAGDSLLVWRDYFPNAMVVGVDIRDRPESIANEARIYFVRGSQDDPETLDAAAAVSGRPFDIIIDDASHIGYLTKRSLYYLFPRWLRPGGHYVIEDLGTAFWPFVPDSAAFTEDKSTDGPEKSVFSSHQHGILGVVKQVIDELMREVATGVPSRLDMEKITFLDGLAVMRKKAATGPI